MFYFWFLAEQAEEGEEEGGRGTFGGQEGWT